MAKVDWRPVVETTISEQVHHYASCEEEANSCSFQLWKIDAEGEDRKVDYLCTLIRHTQAVNVVRWSPKGLYFTLIADVEIRTNLDTGDVLASASDDGNIITWVFDPKPAKPTFGEDGIEDKESWRTKHMLRSATSEIYDLAWSPDGVYFITGSMDNIARIWNAQTGIYVY